VMMGAGRDITAIAQARGMQAARLHAVKQDIGRHLEEADLSVGMLAQRHGCTPRFVQRMFEAELPQSREAHWPVTLSLPQVHVRLLQSK